jgi:hypothetical protein
MLFLYEKTFGFLRRGDCQQRLTWLTARWRDQTIPSTGLKILGRLPVRPASRQGTWVNTELMPECFASAEQVALAEDRRTPTLSAMVEFATQFLAADIRCRQAKEAADGIHQDILDSFEPTVVEVAGEVFILAYRESEAARAAYKAGFHAHQIPGGRLGIDFSWNHLSLAEKEARSLTL